MSWAFLFLAPAFLWWNCYLELRCHVSIFISGCRCFLQSALGSDKSIQVAVYLHGGWAPLRTYTELCVLMTRSRCKRKFHCFLRKEFFKGKTSSDFCIPEERENSGKRPLLSSESTLVWLTRCSVVYWCDSCNSAMESLVPKTHPGNSSQNGEGQLSRCWAIAIRSWKLTIVLHKFICPK